MNRTLLLLSSAALLALVALTSGGRKPGAAAPNIPLVTSKPPPAPVAQAVPAAPALMAVSAGPLTLTSRLSSASVLAGTSQVDAMLDVRAAAREKKVTRQPVSLAVAIDRSGSMSGGKMEEAKRAALALIDQLVAGDRLAIVAFDDGVEVFPSLAVTPLNVEKMRGFVQRIQLAGSTNMSEALEAAYHELQPYSAQYQVSRVVLLSDGQPTVGITAPQYLVSRAESARAFRVSTSAFGVGYDFNVALMRDLANAGGGNSAFVGKAESLATAFAQELGDASQLVARDVRVRVTPLTGVRIVDVPGHAYTRAPGGAVDVSLYDFSPGQSAQLLVRMEVNAPKSGAIGLIDASVWCTELSTERVVNGQARLAASVTQSAAEVAAKQDAEVVQMANRVDVSVKLVEAQNAYRSGDTEGALGKVANIRALFGSSADALAGEDLSNVEHSWSIGGILGAAMDQNLTRKTMKNFGQNNSSAY